MPLVLIKMLDGRTAEQKKRIAEGITDVMVKEAGASKEHVWVLIEEVKKENWAAAGRLLSE